jgi:hypothetical protein
MASNQFFESNRRNRIESNRIESNRMNRMALWCRKANLAGLNDFDLGAGFNIHCSTVTLFISSEAIMDEIGKYFEKGFNIFAVLSIPSLCRPPKHTTVAIYCSNTVDTVVRLVLPSIAQLSFPAGRLPIC